MEVPSMLQGESLKRLLQGIAIGVALTVIVGFNWFSYGFGWTLGGTAEKMALQRVDAALVAAYTPVCVEKFVGPAGRVLAPRRLCEESRVGDLPRCHRTQQQCRPSVRWCSHEIAGCAREKVSRLS